MWHVYILKCADQSFYVGHCHNIPERVSRHNSAQGATWTASRRPVTLAYYESFESKIDAIKREKQIKRWSRAKKQALIDGDLQMLHNLAKR